MTSQFAGRVVLVTGAGHPEGIGHAIAESFEQKEANVFKCDIETTVAQDQFFSCDISQPDQVDEVISAIINQAGTIDVLVNNAGVGVGDADFLNTHLTDWQLSLNVNLLGIVNTCKSAIPHMSEGGSIINIASLAGLGAIDGIPACYTASKFAAIGLTKSLALQFAPQNIRINAVCPGAVVTQMYEQNLKNLSAQYAISIEEAQALESSSIPIGRPASPDEIAEAVQFLASHSARYITGVAMPVAGGMSPGI